MGHKCSEFTPPVLNLGAHVAPLGMKFYTGDQFPADYKNSILIAEHGSWNRHKYQGARIVRVIVGPDGKNAKQDVLASGWIEGDQGYLGRPADIVWPRTVRTRRGRLGGCDLSHQLQQEVTSEKQQAAVARGARGRAHVSGWIRYFAQCRAPSLADRECDEQSAISRLSARFPGSRRHAPRNDERGIEWPCRSHAVYLYSIHYVALHWDYRRWRVFPPTPQISPQARKKPSCASAVMAKAAFREPRTFPRWQANPISSFSGSWFSSAAARARTSRCSRSSSKSTMMIFAISALTLLR